ncbi:hypothetical protein ACIQU4_17540 [Streptomyces sp. NPDC090741]|uniref:hypothetical protein n=1 Tax=Streptomyces sp. NPDC090741 TaxID=3365967 RepID=UPI00381A6D14
MSRQLNERQQQMLQWVGRGCPDGVWEGTGHKLSCQALHSRGLVKVFKRQGQWSVALTKAGEEYLDHGSHPPEQPRSKETTPAPQAGIQSPDVAKNEKPGVKAAVPVPVQRTSSLPRTKARTVTEQLLEELVDAGGRIVKREASGRETEKWPIRVAAARRSGKIPATKELHADWCHDGYEIRLVDTPAWRLAVLPPVPVPARLTATQKLGYASAFGTAESAPAPHRRRSGPPHFTITAQGQRCDFLILQEQDRTEHIPTKKEIADAEKNPWVRIPRYDTSPAERLRICVSGGLRHRTGEWADTTSRPLEDQLAEIVQEVGLRGEAAERKRLADLEAAREKRLKWEAAMQRAKIEFAEAARVQHLEAQERAWRRAAGLAEYVDALRLHAQALATGPERDGAEAWIARAADHVERLNPLNGTLRLPDIPEPRASDLQPFLHGWNPYGPGY